MDRKIIDNHVHIAGPGDAHPDDLYWSPRFERSVGYWSLIVLKGWAFRKVDDTLMIGTVMGQARGARRVDRFVLLALDDVYEPGGADRGHRLRDTEPDRIQTSLYTSNRFVVDRAAEEPKCLAGISVHPFRPDAIEELDRWQSKAVLCKWLPSAQQIRLDVDESPLIRDKLMAFYARLAEIRLPLLVHTGIESSIPSAAEGFDRYNNPELIVPALEAGVTVILAHCGNSYFEPLQTDFVEQALGLFERRKKSKPDWRLYADISAVFSPFRDPDTLDRIFDRVDPDRLIYGSDFPNPARGWKESLLRPFLRYGRVNLLDRSYRVAVKSLRAVYRRLALADRTKPPAEPDALKPEIDGKIRTIMTNLHRVIDDCGRGGLV